MTKFGFCEFCGKQCFGGKSGFVCVDCYKPKNPTFGWLVSEYMRRGFCTKQFYEMSKNSKAKLERFLYQTLGITPVKASKLDKNNVHDR